MTDEPPYRAADTVLLRIATLPEREAARTWVDLDPDRTDHASGAELFAYIRRLGSDPLLREAVAVASRPLARELDRLEREGGVGAVGRPLRMDGSDIGVAGRDRARLRRVAFALTRYLLRMSTRPTPFGLFAGVMSATVHDGAKVRIGTGHRRAVRTDLGWLNEVVSDWERRPEVLAGAWLTVNDLCQVRGDRVVLDCAHEPPADDAAVIRPGAGPYHRQVSLRHTTAVREIMERTAHPVRAAALVDRLRARFGVAESAAVTLVTRLVEQEVLLTDLRALTGVDPAARLRTRLPSPQRDVLDELARLADTYAGTPLGTGQAAWRSLTAASDAVRASDSPFQVDLRMDVDVRLPRIVTATAESAAAVLLRLSRPEPGQSHLRDYHVEFLERYGTDRLVPVMELLDTERGLGPPAGYDVPAGSRPVTPHPPNGTQDLLLGELAERAVHDGAAEVVLDDALIDELAPHSDATPPPSLELYTHLVAASTAALDAGDFRLVVTGMVGSLQAGATLGRFAHLLDDATEHLADLVRASVPDSMVPVQLDHPHFPARLANVTRVPAVTAHRIAIGVSADRRTVPGVDDLFVGADTHRMFVVSRSLGRQVCPVSPHMLSERRTTPNVVRLLREIPHSGQRQWHGFGWGTLDALPYLPRVRHGRTVLSPARWRPARILGDADLSWPRWYTAFAEWRDRWRVPALVQATLGDHRVTLNLDVGLHLRLLRSELRRRPGTLLFEAPGGPAGTGWLDGHANELVFALLARSPSESGVEGQGAGSGAAAPTPASAPERSSAPPRSQPASQSVLQLVPQLASRSVDGGRARSRVHPPGGEWVYAKLYAGAARHDTLLADHLPRLLAALPAAIDRWFYLRYADPDPHLRLRFHGDPSALATDLLPALHDWVAEVCRQGLARSLVLDTYDPEWERYGGPDLMAAAERAFCADSQTALTLVRLRHRGALDLAADLLCAASFVNLLRAVDHPDWQDWLCRTVPKGPNQAAFRAHRRAALDLVDPEGDWAGLRARPDGAAVHAAWQERSAALAEYARRLRAEHVAGRAWTAPDEVVGSLLHLHHNRLVGIDRGNEQRSHAIARGVIQARRDRAAAARRTPAEHARGARTRENGQTR